MKKILITFGGRQYDETAKLIVERAKGFGVDEVKVYDDKWFLKQDFLKLKSNQWLVNHPHKRGLYWYVWKPYIIWHALEHAQDGDIVMFIDADTVPIADLSVLYRQCEHDGGIMLFAASHWRQNQWCKKDCYVVMGQDKPEYKDVQAGVARFMIFKKGPWQTTQFLMEWMAYCVNPLVNTFDKSVLGVEDPAFREHRCEQAALTNLAHKYGLKLYREACEAGNGFDNDKDLYPQLFTQINPNAQVTQEVLGSEYFNVE